MIFLFVGLMFAAGGYAGYWTKKLLERARAIEEMPVSRIGDAREGLVKLHGRAVPGEQKLVCPISQEDALYYSYTIERWRNSGKHHRWAIVNQLFRFVPFYLEDESGKVELDLADANVELSQDCEFVSGFLHDPAEHIRKFMDEHGIEWEFLGMNHRMRYRAFQITPGEVLSLYGTKRNGIVGGSGTKLYLRDCDPEFLTDTPRFHATLCGIASFGFIAGGVVLIFAA